MTTAMAQDSSTSDRAGNLAVLAGIFYLHGIVPHLFQDTIHSSTNFQPRTDRLFLSRMPTADDSDDNGGGSEVLLAMR